MNKKELYFLAFANKSYMTTDRIANQAKEMNVFDKIFQLTEDDISEYIVKHSNFIKRNPYGYGLFIWKPKIIYDTLLKMNNEDILVYCDAFWDSVKHFQILLNVETKEVLLMILNYFIIQAS